MSQATLDFDRPRISGSTYDANLDEERLGAQMRRVYRVMQDGGWYTLADLEARGCGPQASVSARLRDLRNKYAKTIHRRRQGDPTAGVWEYRMEETL